MHKYGSWVSYSRREMEALGEPVGMPDRGPAFGEFLDIGSILGSVAAPIIGGLFGSDASSDAADAQTQSASDANALQKYMYDQSRTDQAPFRDVGVQGINKLADALGISGNSGAAGYGSLSQPFNAASVANDPGYQFGLTQGQNALNRQATAAGSLYSGAQLKAASQYGNDYATTKYTDAFNRDLASKNQTYNQLAGVSGAGQTATNQVTASGQNYANQAASNITGAGNARASGYVGSANSLTSGLSGAYNNYSTNNLLNSLLGKSTTSSTPTWSSGASFGSSADYGNLGGIFGS